MPNQRQKSFRQLVSLLILLLGAWLPPAIGMESPATEQQPAAAVEVPKDVAGLKAIEEQVKKVVAKVLSCTVGVQVGSARGSGVIVTKDGYVMTAGHVVGKPGQKVTFFFADGKTAKGTTLGMHKTTDSGLMKITDKNITDKGEWPFVEMGKSADLKEGAWAVASGHPLGYQPGRPPVIRLGRILRVRDTVIQTDCPLVAGDSGGPLFDLNGKVIGINSRIGGSTSMNFHVAVDVYHEFWDRLVKSESWQADLPAKDSSPVKAAFRKVVAEPSQCVVRVKCEGKDAALGTIVGPNGWVLTKASELKGAAVCHLRDGRELAASTVGVDPRFDLAMLKVEATGLPSIKWNLTDASVGQWVASAGLADDPLALGVISVPRRTIPPESGVLGVAVNDADGGAKVIKVMPKSAARKAGLQVDDVITHVNGKPTKSNTELVAAIRKYRPGDSVKLKIVRGDQTLDISATLTKLATTATHKRELQNRSGVGVSERRASFPAVLQHDTVLRPQDCGGPLVDLQGKVLGVNIARAGRTETYSVPSNLLVVLMYDLMSGRLTPPKPAAKPEPEKKPEPPKKPAPKPEPPKKPVPEKKAEPKPEPPKKPEPKPEPPKKPEPKPEPAKKPEPEKKPAPKPEPAKKPAA